MPATELSEVQITSIIMVNSNFSIKDEKSVISNLPSPPTYPHFLFIPLYLYSSISIDTF